MKDVFLALVYIVMIGMPLGCAAYVAGRGQTGWGWFLAFAVLMLLGTKLKITNP